MATMSPSGMEAGATPPTPSTEQGRGGGNAGSAAAKDEESKLYEFKEQLLLLSTLVATVTYVAGLNLPGGYWEQGNPGGHVPGDPILPDTHYRRYLAFYYCNATALAASLVVSLILIALPNKRKYWTVALRSVMMLDLLGLMGAYGAGSCRDAFTTIYAVVIFSSLVVVIIFVFFYVCHMAKDSPSTQPPTGGSLTSTSPPVGIVGSTLIPTSPGGVLDKNHSTTNEAGGAPDSNLATIIVHENEVQSNSSSKANKMKRGSMFKHATTKIRALIKFKKPDKKRAEKEQIDVLMLLATFVVTITYVAGLSPPGGFWSSTQDGHHLSDPVLQARGRYRGFFICNTTSFAVSLLIIVLLLERKLLKAKLMSTGFTVRFTVPYLLVAVTLLGLMGAYAAGGCREADNTALVLAVPACVSLLLGIVTYIIGWKELTHIREYVIIFLKKLVGIPSGTCPGTDIELHHQNTRDLVMLLATLVVTITYQAGLEPPGGLWLDDRDGHKMSHPVLEVTHPTRYKVFFYSNSAAFITSLVVIMMLQSKFLLTRHTLEATLVLDLFGLVTAYGAGSTRDVNTSIYIVALAGLVLVYVIVHITIRDHTPEPADDHAVKHLDDKRKVLLLVAILAATLTYQAGLTPPGGFWLEDDQGLGRRAGFPVLLDNYPRRYNSFFYCNAASFMASITLILLLVNPKLYRPGIRCYALYVCMLVGMFGLMGAYAAGSARQLKTSIYVLTLVGMVLAFIVWLAAISWLIIRSRANKKENNNSNNNRSTAISITTAISSSTSTTSGESSSSHSGGGSTTSSNHNSGGGSSSSNNSCSTTTSNKNNSNNDGDNNPEKDTLEYLMLLGILAASMTYQTGLKPPGGLWQDNNSEHSAGNPVLHDINKHRYNIFFYSNTTSFMASIIVIVLLLPWTTFHEPKPPLWPMHMTILLDMVGLLVAYAAGSTRDWEASRNIMFLIIPVLFYIALYATASVLFRKEGRSCKTWLASWWPAQQAEPGSGEQQKTSHSWSSLCLHTQPSSTGKTEVALAV